MSSVWSPPFIRPLTLNRAVFLWTKLSELAGFCCSRLWCGKGSLSYITVRSHLLSCFPLGRDWGKKIQILPFLFLKCVFYNHHLLAGLWQHLGNLARIGALLWWTMTEVYSLESREIVLLGCKSTWAKEVRQLHSKSSAHVTNSRDIIKVSHHPGLFSEQHLLLSCESTRSSAFIKPQTWFKPCWFQVKSLKNMGSRREIITHLRYIEVIHTDINF